MDTLRHRMPDNPLYSLPATSSTVNLSTEPGFFRLIDLSPGQWNDEIHCTLTYYNRLRDRYPPYQALSYVWGRPRRNPPEILVNGYKIKVTANLETALKYLRDHEERVTLWIDALCIDQSNTEERSSQVAQMREIYSNASEVIIFLGNGLDYSKQHSKSPGDLRPFKRFEVGTVDASAAIDAWKASPLKTPIQAYEIFSFLTAVAQCLRCSDLFKFLADFPPDHLTQLSEALRRTLLVSWWDRIWVVQEAVVAKQLTVRYGNVEISWGLLAEVATLLHDWESSYTGHPSYIPTSDLKVFKLFSRVSNLDHFRENWRRSQGIDLLSLMRHFGHRKASDDRDRVYALLGLCNQTTAIRPDYWLDVKEVFMAPVIETIRNTKSLSVLYGDHSRKTRRDIPSWVPDWSTELDENQRQRATLSSLFNASKGVTPIFITDTSKTFKHESIKREMALLLDSLKAEVDTRALLREELAQKLRGLNTKSTSPEIEEIGHLCEALADYCHKDGQRDLPKYGLIHHSGHSLAVHGVKIATVSQITEPLYASSDRNSTVEVLKRWRETMTRSKARIYPSFQANFLKTILSDAADFGRAWLKRLNTKDTKALLWWLNRTLSQNSREEDEDPCRSRINTTFGHFGHFTDLMRLSTTNRTFFLTKPYYSNWSMATFENVGLGPMLIKEGDEIYILPGSNLPLVLRPVSYCNSQGHSGLVRKYQLIGDCFLQGVMDGELGSTGGNILDYLDYLTKLSYGYWKGFGHTRSILDEQFSEYMKSFGSEIPAGKWRFSEKGMSFEAGRYFASPGDYHSALFEDVEARVGDLVALEIV
ncbi:HET domain-containing protein [Trichoderma simmonsii]|uniref:HET domain-containing protein n=1 Tax=Trichoderma simmonsii TaxID=1491479 RepID=A0A8G0PKX1_9HYPO|nr:HET domain-containing protein [Trichoderma simmonsii]